MRIFVSGTIAYDVILDYPGRFADHINPKKIHAISLSFLIDRARRSVGGTAANIAYNLSMLGVWSSIIGAVGDDGRELVKQYRAAGIDVSNLKISKQLGTATAFIMTDRDDNQIAGFYPGATRERAKLPKVKKGDLAIIAAEHPANMARLARHYQKNKLNYIFDPGQAITALSKRETQVCLRGASILIGNDYEVDYILKKFSPFPNPRPTSPGRPARQDFVFSKSGGSPGGRASHQGKGKKEKNFSPLVGEVRWGVKSIIIRTLGPKGSEIIFPDRKRIKIGIAKPKKVLDPTGAGDAYRAGLIKGIISGLDLRSAAKLGAAAASFAVESYGTQNHKFTYDILVGRHNKNFKDKI